MNAQRLDDAENAFRQALTKEPGWATARHHLGVVLAQRGDFEHALAELREAGLLRPDDSEIRTDLADTLVAAGMPDEALVYYRQFERVVPPNSALYAAIARAEGMGGHFAEAQESAKHALALDRNNGEAWMLLSAAQVERGDFGEAERSLEAPAALLPNDVRVKLSWATLRYKQGRRAEAEAMLRTAVQSYPSSVQARSLLLEYAQDRAAAERFLQHLPSAGQAR